MSELTCHVCHGEVTFLLYEGDDIEHASGGMGDEIRTCACRATKVVRSSGVLLGVVPPAIGPPDEGVTSEESSEEDV